MMKISRRAFLAASGAASLAGSRATKAQGLETLNIGLSPYINQATIFMQTTWACFPRWASISA
jgi:hypothetical protein